MYTAYDFINNDIESKHMKAGWKVEVSKLGFIVLRYTILNFEWKSLEFLGDEAWDLFLNSKSYSAMKTKLGRALAKYKKLYFDAVGINELKVTVEKVGLHIDIDKLVSKTIAKKSEKIQEDFRIKKRLQELSNYA